MDSSPSSIASTVTDGIQEISALLPLLGTEQCEEHTGSALGKGYLYTCITPISTFGSLGIVKAAFNILVASIIVPSWGFLGAQRLADGGFRPRGDVAPLIALDPQHPQRFLAETNLDKLIEDAHIENVEDVKINWGAGSLRWNIKMIICTFIVSSLGITPYLYIILHRLPGPTDKPVFLSGWAFPIARVVGCAIAGIIVQIIVQIRTLVIIKNRLVFLTIDRYIKNKFDQNHIDMLHEHLPDWGAHKSSEMCLWDLQVFLKNQARAPVPTFGASTPSLPYRGDRFQNGTIVIPMHHASKQQKISDLEDYFERTKDFHFRRRRYVPWFSSLGLEDLHNSATYIFLHILLIVSIILSIAGYLGCFNLVQNAGTHAGTILWLVFEILLCFLRILVWAWNPTLDDNKGLEFGISLAPQGHSPLLTCNIYGNELESINDVPVVRSQTFLTEIASYTGPLPAFSTNDAALYYILTGTESASQTKVLYIVVSTTKEQTSEARLIVKKGYPNREGFSFFVCELKSMPRQPVMTIDNILAEGQVGPEIHILTSNPAFLKDLSDHYDAILQRLDHLDRGQSLQFHSGWNLRNINTDLENNGHPNQPILTSADIEYLKQGGLERGRDQYAESLEFWINSVLARFEKEIFEQISFNSHSLNKMTKHQEIEITEAEYLIAHARYFMELCLLNIFSAWRQLIVQRHSDMDRCIIAFFNPLSTPNLASLPSISGSDFESDSVRKIRDRLDAEKEFRHKRFPHLDWTRMCGRIDYCCAIVQERIDQRRYLYPKEGSRIVEHWRDLRLGMNELWTTYLTSGSEAWQNIPNSTSLTSTIDVGSLTGQYYTEMKQRLQCKERFLRGEEGKELRDRCSLRFEQWRTGLQASAEELMTVMIGNPPFASDNDNLGDISARKYWSPEAVQCRLSLMGNHKYVVVTDPLVNDLGGFESLALALKQSGTSNLYFMCRFSPVGQPSPVVIKEAFRQIYQAPSANIEPPTTYYANQFMPHRPQGITMPPVPVPGLPVLLSQTMLSIVANTPTLTGIYFPQFSGWSLSDVVQAEIDKNVANILQKTGIQMVCKYEDMEITNYFRRSELYVFFRDPTSSRCVVNFCVDENIDYSLTLTHAFTRTETEVHITLNDETLAKTTASSRYKSGNSPEFYEERVDIPKNLLRFRPMQNVLTVKLGERSESNSYFLEDIAIDRKNPDGQEHLEEVVYTDTHQDLEDVARDDYCPMM